MSFRPLELLSTRSSKMLPAQTLMSKKQKPIKFDSSNPKMYQTPEDNTNLRNTKERGLPESNGKRIEVVYWKYVLRSKHGTQIQRFQSNDYKL